MSRFAEAMELGNEALVHETGDGVVLWPLGEEADAREIEAIWTGQARLENEAGRTGQSEFAAAEAQVWADDTRGIADPAIKSDVLVRGGQTWLVMEVLETVAGMHRLRVELVERNVVGRGRGRR